MLESLQLLNWATHWYKLYLKWQWWQFGTIDKPGTSLFPQYTIRSARHTFPILLVSTLLDFSTPNFKATVISTFVIHLLWKFTKWLKNVEKMLCVVLWNSCVWFWNYVPLKVVPLFLHQPIHEERNIFLSFCRERSVILWNICVYRYHLRIQTWTALCKGWAKSLPNASNTRVGVLLICNTQQKTN